LATICQHRHRPERRPGSCGRGRASLAGILVIAFLLGGQANTITRAQPATTDRGTASAPSAVPIPTIEQRLGEADRLRIEGYYDRAAEIYEPLVSRGAASVRATVGTAACYRRLGRYADATDVLEHAADDGAASAAWHLERARIAQCSGQYEDAIDHARQAIALDKSSAPARLLLAETLEIVNRRDDALEVYTWFDRVMTTRLPDDAAELTAVGTGFLRYSVLNRHPSLVRRTRHVLNEVYQVAYERLDRSYWPARVAAADLLRNKYNLDEAEADYRAALRINPNAADARVGLGRIALEHWDFDSVEKHVELALQINPNHVAALNLLAESRITERRYDEVQSLTDRALNVNPRDLESLALAAAAYLATNDKDAAKSFLKRAHRVNPASMRVQSILADTLGGLRQFASAERHYHKAIKFDPSAPAPRIELGLMYMQWGDEAQARKTLEAAWRLDPFNDQTKNTLELLDRIESFDTIATDHFIIRYEGDKDRVIAEQASRYLESIYQPLCDDFDATLSRKTTIEIFPAHSEFAVRITGKPWIHTVGACTGWVIAVDSPRRDVDLGGPYDLASVLRHEFTHTVTLAVTNNRIPHWFTEGLAVLQEDSDRSFAWMSLLADAVRRERLFTLKSIDWGFIRPRRPNDRTLAYAQSEWMCEYLIERNGYDVINEMLDAFAGGQAQPEVFQQLVGVSPSEFDELFTVWARQQVRNWGFDLRPVESVHKLQLLAAVQPDDARLQARLAAALYDDQQWDEALKAARRALTLDDSDNRLALQIAIRLLRGEHVARQDETSQAVREDQLIRLARKLIELDENNWLALKTLAEVYIERNQLEKGRPWLVRLKRTCPRDPFAPRVLAGIALKKDNLDAALSNLLIAARSETHDAALPRQIGQIYARRDSLHDARYWYQRALHIDPMADSIRAELAQVYMRLDDLTSAADQYRLLCELDPQNAEYHSDCALALDKLGDDAGARTHARRAVALDPSTPAAAILAD